MLVQALFNLVWILLWAITIFSTINSILCNSLVMWRMLSNTTGSVGNKLLKQGNLYDWVTCTGWATIIVLWGH